MWSRTFRVMLHEGFEHHKIEYVHLQISRANADIRRCSALTVIFYSIFSEQVKFKESLRINQAKSGINVVYLFCKEKNPEIIKNEELGFRRAKS